MTPAETILKMIEGVDPDYRGGLDEIDALVWCWKHDLELLPDQDNHGFYYFIPETKATGWKEIIKYTRSRDALKDARPKWCMFSMAEMDNGGGFSLGYGCDLRDMQGNLFRADGLLPTEELAELHAIIQALEWERDNA